MRPHPRSTRHGFTLVELLATIAIVGLMAALLVGAVQRIQRKAGTTKSAANMRQVATSIFSVAQDQNNTIPAPMPANNLEWWSLGPVFNKAYGFVPQGEWWRKLRWPGDTSTDAIPARMPNNIFVAPNHDPVKATALGVPNQQNSYNWGYALNSDLPPAGWTNRKPMARIAQPSRTMLLIESGNIRSEVGHPGNALWIRAAGEVRNDGKVHVMFADGHIETLPTTNLPPPADRTFWFGE